MELINHKHDHLWTFHRYFDWKMKLSIDIWKLKCQMILTSFRTEYGAVILAFSVIITVIYCYTLYNCCILYYIILLLYIICYILLLCIVIHCCFSDDIYAISRSSRYFYVFTCFYVLYVCRMHNTDQMRLRYRWRTKV